MILSKIKTYALIAASGLLAVAYALFKSEQAARAREKLQASERARKAEIEAAKALQDGLRKEKEAKHGEVDTSNRDHFSS